MSSRILQFNKTDFWCCVAIFCLGASARILFLQDYSQSSIFPFMPYSDSYHYFLWGKDIASGDLWSPANHAFMKWPLYAYLLGLELVLMKGNAFFMQLLQFFFGVINCVLVYFIGRLMFRRAVGMVAAFFCLCYGQFIFYEGLLTYTSFSLLLNSLLFLFVLVIRRKPFSKRKLFFLGIFLGLATITQGNIVIFGILAAAGVLLEYKLKARKVITGFLSFLFGLSLVVGSVTLRNYVAEKDFVLMTGNMGVTFYLGNNPQASGRFDRASDLAMSQEDMFKNARIIAKVQKGGGLSTSQVSYFWMKKGIDFIRRQPLRYVALFARKVWYMFSPQEYVHDTEYYLLKDSIRIFKMLFMDLTFLMPLAFTGMILGMRKIKDTAYLYLITFTLVFATAFFLVTSRFRIVIVPFLALFAAFGLFGISKALWEKRYGIFILLCGLVLGAHFLLNPQAVFDKKPVTHNASGMVEYYSLRATIEEQKGNYQGAIEQLERAQHLDPGNRGVIFRLGAAHYALKQWQPAEDKFLEIVKRFPYYVDAYYNLGLMYNQQKRFNEALDYLKKAVWLNPDDAKANFELGISFKETGDYANARKEFLAALKMMNRWRLEERAVIEKEINGLPK